MNSRAALVTAAVLAIGLIALEAFLVIRPPTGERWFDEKDRQAGAMVDRLVFLDTRDALAAGTMEHVALADDEPARIVLHFPEPKGYPREGTWTSPRVVADFAFTELLPSWNVATPSNTGVKFHVRTRDAATQRWTPWLRIGSWGRTTLHDREPRCAFGVVDEDTLKLTRPADAYQIRATLQSYDFSADVNPSVRRITVSYSGPLEGDSLWARAMNPSAPLDAWARSLDVPYIPQGDNADPIAGMTCSPTSLSMVLRYWGVDRATMENCVAIWDDHNDIFGNWSNATQRAAEVGMDAWLQHFRNWDQVKAMIARGQPIVASIKYEKGTFFESDKTENRETDGHLLVIRGFTPEGNVIVNDPGKREIGNALVLSARGMAHAWFAHGGVGYVIRPPPRPLPASLVKGPATAPATTAPVAEVSPSPRTRGEGRGEGMAARGDERRSPVKTQGPSPQPSPPSTGERE